MFEISIDQLPGTSVITKRCMKSLGIRTYFDLLNYFPFRYENYSAIAPINTVQEEKVITVRGKVENMTQLRTRRGFKIQKVTISDGTGRIELTWYNQPYLLTLLKPGLSVSASGTAKKFGNKTALEVREYEILRYGAMTLHTGRLVPIYPEKRGLSSRTLREKIFLALEKLNGGDLEFLPAEIRENDVLINENVAYKNIHFPESSGSAYEARKRLSFDEVFVIQLSSLLVREKWEKERVTTPLKIFEKQIDSFVKSLPFKLTASQKQAADEILRDLTKTKPMNRFLQGEVGSGKTVVAAIGSYLTYLNDYKTLFMAPTEILAQQHYQTFKSLLRKPSICLVTGSVKPTTEELKNTDIVIGTHALIQKKLDFARIGLIVIDEQHRFGVAQRAKLKEKGINPHLLTMTATPIPRTVTLTLHGELDLSVISEMPKGRIPTKTYLVPKAKRQDAYRWIKEKIRKDGTQVFIICPLVEESDKETMQSVKAAKKEYEYLRDKVFNEFKVGLLHGKIKGKEKNEIMSDFKSKQYDLLVATSVVEVGIDVPNANIIVIEGADRYGLAQLHQLRGRVGRDRKQAYCLVFTEKDDDKTLQRLKFFVLNSEGLKLAEYDLKKRGPGEMFGLKQHGVTEFKIASFADLKLITETKKAAVNFKNTYSLSKYPQLEKRLEKFQTELISRD